MTVYTKMIVASTGAVDWSAPLTMISSCPVNVHLYPFDVQACELKFGSWQHDKLYIDYVINEDFPKDMLNVNGEWDLLSKYRLQRMMTRLHQMN